MADKIKAGPATPVRSLGHDGATRTNIPTAELQSFVRDELVGALFPDGDDDLAALRESALLGIEDLNSPTELYERLLTQITQPDMPESGDFVRIMSLHKSKGLTSRAVVVNSCIEGLTPFRDDDEPIEDQRRTLAEQRRLFYVAITRCTDLVVLSSFTSIDRSLARRIGATLRPGGTQYSARCIASRFLDELGPTAPQSVAGTAWETRSDITHLIGSS